MGRERSSNRVADIIAAYPKHADQDNLEQQLRTPNPQRGGSWTSKTTLERGRATRSDPTSLARRHPGVAAGCRDSAKRLLRGEGRVLVSRSLGVTAATPTAWRDAFLAADVAALTTRPVTGEQLESDLPKARLGQRSSSATFCMRRSPPWRPTALWPGGRSNHELRHIAGQRQAVWHGGGLPRLAARSLRHQSPPVSPPPDAPLRRHDHRRDGGTPCGGDPPGRAPILRRVRKGHRPGSMCGTLTDCNNLETIALLGIECLPAFVRAKGNGCAERFIRTLKENLLWVRTFEELARRSSNSVRPTTIVG